MLANKGSEVNNRKAEQEILNLKKNNEQITENIEKIKEDKKTGNVTSSSCSPKLEWDKKVPYRDFAHFIKFTAANESFISCSLDCLFLSHDRIEHKNISNIQYKIFLISLLGSIG